MKTRPLTLGEVEITIEVESEDIPVRGNYMCTDDAEADRKAEDEIISLLERGYTEAWCCIKVTAKWRTYRGFAYLGGCTFLPPHDKFGDIEEEARSHGMPEEALSDLNSRIAAIAKELHELVET